jgi:peptidoglycan/xylan/chitin deacetylase (PgdA/CDA1 family)
LRPLVRDVASDILYRSGVTLPSHAARGWLTIVTFHRVLADEELAEYPLPQLAVSVGEFAWFAAFFARHYTCGSLADVHRRWLDGERPARPFLALTFDDGQLDNFRNALPALRRQGLKATFFVPADAIDSGEPLWHDRLGHAARRLLERDRTRALELFALVGTERGDSDRYRVRSTVSQAKRLSTTDRLEFVACVEKAAGEPQRPSWDGFMSWEQLRSLVRDGHEIGSHSASHPILPPVDDAQLQRESLGSRTRIEAQLEASCESFCYPNGDCDARVVDAIRRAGYRRAVTTAWGPNALGGDPLQLTRCDLQGAHARSRSGRLSAERLALRLSRHFPSPRT